MKSDTQEFLQKARENLAAAQLLQRERFWDICASRAYYAMFYAAEALLLERELAFSSHSAVIAAFGREFAKSGALDPQLHRFLLNAFNARNASDYDAHSGITSAQAEELLAWAQQFVAAAESYLVHHP